MIRLETKLAVRDAYLETVGSQLKMLDNELGRLHKESRHIKPTARYAYYHTLRAAEDQFKVVQKNYQDLSLAGLDKWESLKVEIDANFSTLQLEIQKVRKSAHELKHGSISWARGMAPDHIVDTAGWAEGLAEEDPVTSMGWAEGQAKEDIVESIGWAEGQAKKNID
jgi:hypothetical protein